MDGSAPGAALRRRGPREWWVDTCLFLFALLWGLVMSAIRLDQEDVPTVVPGWLFNLDQLTGVVGCALVWLRRRHPVGVPVILVVLSSYSETVAGVMLVGLFAVAVHRPPRTSLLVFGLSLLAAVVYVVVRPEPGQPPFLLLCFGAALQGAAFAWGLAVHHRRRLVLSLRERAERAEAEAWLRAERAQRRARDEIAREIHDVLGHRLSLLSVHAGALEYRPDAPAEDISRAAGVIRENAHQALQDLREVIGVLRAPVGGLPQPTAEGIEELVEESRRAGMEVGLRGRPPREVPERLGRTAYRIVQEALTNARKHAPGSRVEVGVAGTPRTGLTVEVVNTAPATVPDPGDGRGQGLIGLAERVRLAGGDLSHGPTAQGGWKITARLPWPS
ncbi:histidine kinase [Marinactinospora endophytica]